MLLASLGVCADDEYYIFIIIETAIDILYDDTVIRCDDITFNIDGIIKFLYILVLAGIL